MDNIAIKVENLSKDFKLPYEKTSTIKSAIVNFWRRDRGYEMQHALNDINFEIKKGEFFGIVGRNGSGKSTLLKLLAGIYSPTKGTVEVNGSLTPFIELGVGFNPELTGRENVYLNGALLGFNRIEMTGMYKDIVEFAELKPFMDQKLKNYSSGMQVRLAFSIAIRAKSDILLIDEVLAVGDAAFQQKCFDYFRQLKKSKRTVVFVSHDLNSVQEFCDRVAIIDDGRLKGVGSTNVMVRSYETIIAERQETVRQPKKNRRPGTGDCQITEARILNKSGKPIKLIGVGEPFIIEVVFVAKKKAEVVVGLAVSDETGIVLYSPNTEEAGMKISTKPQEKKKISAVFNNNSLVAGSYLITAGIFDSKGLVPFDFFENVARFKILGERKHGKIDSRPKWSMG